MITASRLVVHVLIVCWLHSTALFKVANGEDIGAAEKPGMFDLKVRIVRPVSLPSPSI